MKTIANILSEITASEQSIQMQKQLRHVSCKNEGTGLLRQSGAEDSI